MQQLPLIDTLVLLVYLAGIVGFGSWFVRRSRSTEQFMAAGRSLPGWAVGLSIFGTYVSSISFLANPGKSYGEDWNRFVFGLSLPVAAWVAVRWFVPFYRRGGQISAYDHLEHRFGPWARTYAVVCYLLTQLGRMGTIMYLVALALAPLTGWPVPTIIIITGALVTVYTLLGGIEAVIWTDVVQSIVLTGGAVTCALLILAGMPEGPGQVFTIAAGHGKFSLGDFGSSIAVPTFWVVLINGLFINLQNFGIDQSYVQRYITAESDRAAARSVWLGALLYIPISALLFFVGTALFAYYQTQPDMLAEVRVQVAEENLAELRPTLSPDEYRAKLAETAKTLKPEDIGDKVLPHFIAHKLPRGITGLLIAAVFAAAMSSVDSSLNCSATLFLQDIYKRYIRRHCEVGQRESMRVLYLATLVWGAAGTATALAMIGQKSALDAWWTLASIFSGGMLGLFLLGLISRRAENPAAATGVIIGVLAILWMTVSRTDKWPHALAQLRSPFHSFMIIVVGTLTILLVGLVVSRLTGRREPAAH